MKAHLYSSNLLFSILVGIKPMGIGVPSLRKEGTVVVAFTTSLLDAFSIPPSQGFEVESEGWWS